MRTLLEVLDPPNDWNVQRFDRLVRRVQESGRSDLQSLSVFLGQGVVPRSTRDDNHNRLGADLSKYLVVKPGDIVFNKLRTWQGGLGVSKYEGIVSPAYYVCRPREDVEPRFLHYLLRSATYLQELTRISKWMPPSQFDISWQDLRLLPTLAPRQEMQRAIADFLDAETARIDALIAKKRRMVSVLDERFTAYVEQKTCASSINRARYDPLPDGWRSVVLRRCFQLIQYGIGEASREVGAIAVLGMGNVDRGEIVGSPGGFVDNLDPSLLLESGDLLFNRTNSLALVGKVALVRTSSVTTFASYLVRLRTNHLADSAYLNYLLNTRPILQQARSMALPSIGQANLNPSRYTSIRVPLPPVQDQRFITADLDLEAANHNKLSTALTRQIDLLTEHRQALVTAAVMGEIEVPGVAVPQA